MLSPEFIIECKFLKVLEVLTISSYSVDNSRIKPEHKTIVEGFTNFTFNCDSKNPEKTVWRYDNNELPLNAQSNGNVLHLHYVNRFNSGYFECQFIYGKHYWSGNCVKYYAKSELTVICKLNTNYL